jgi:chaperonin GroES
MPITLPPKTTITPNEDTIFCRMYAQTGTWKTGSKIIIPDTAREEVFFAHVVAVGPGRTIDVDPQGEIVRKPMTVKPNDDVVFARYHGERIVIEGSLYILMRQDDVLATITMDKAGKDTFFKLAGVNDSDEAALEGAKIK